MVLRWRYNGVTMVSDNGVTMVTNVVVLQCCDNDYLQLADVLMVLQWRYTGVLVVSQWVLNWRQAVADSSVTGVMMVLPHESLVCL
jgi:hypothetical protein